MKKTTSDFEIKKKAVFLDRDGTINIAEQMKKGYSHNYVHKIEDFKFIPKAIEALKLLAMTDYVIVIITNQGGIAKGIHTKEDVDKVNKHMIQELEKEGVEVGGIYYCPHHPEGIVKEYAIICDCKKPGAKMLLDAAKDLNLDLKKSWMIGDKFRDAEAGKKAGCKTIVVKTGDEPLEYYNQKNDYTDYIEDNLASAVKIIMDEDKKNEEDYPTTNESAQKENKIITLNEAKILAEEFRKEGKKIVTCNGSFDLLHWGHIQILNEAKKQGDVLIVGLNSNESVHKYKSKDRPIVDEKYRAQMLAALESVNYVVLMDEAEIAVPLIKAVKPNVHVNGSEYGENCVEAPAVKEVGARLYLVPKMGGFSTTDLIDKILKVYGK